MDETTGNNTGNNTDQPVPSRPGVSGAVASALREFGANRTRAGLTAAGVAVGVAMVILLASFGSGMRANYDAETGNLANQITITPSDRHPAGKSLTDGVVTALGDRTWAPDVAAISPAVAAISPAQTGSVALTAGPHRDLAVLVACTQNYLPLIHRQVTAGEWFSADQMAAPPAGVPPVVLGPRAVSRLYPRRSTHNR